MIEHALGHVWAVEPPRSVGTWTSFMVEGVDTASMALPPRRLRRAPWFCGRGAKIPTKTHDVRRRRSDGRRKTVKPKSTTILLLCFLFLAPVFYFWFFPKAQLEERYECMRASVGSFFPGLHVQLAPIIRVQRFELNYNISYHSYNKSLFGYQIPHMLL